MNGITPVSSVLMNKNDLKRLGKFGALQTRRRVLVEWQESTSGEGL